MRKTVTVIALMLLSAVKVYADKKQVDLKEVKSVPDRTEVGTEPSATYDDATNSVEMAIEAEEQFKLKVIDSTGKTVYACPVMMSGGIPVNYILPQLPAGAYTLRVESDTVIYEGTLFIN